jgi:hypothetical protein
MQLNTFDSFWMPECEASQILRTNNYKHHTTPFVHQETHFSDQRLNLCIVVGSTI